jgi:hypothetical protein
MMPISAVLVRGKFALATFGPGRASKYIYDADDGLVTVRPVLDPSHTLVNCHRWLIISTLELRLPEGSVETDQKTCGLTFTLNSLRLNVRYFFAGRLVCARAIRGHGFTAVALY